MTSGRPDEPQIPWLILSVAPSVIVTIIGLFGIFHLHVASLNLYIGFMMFHVSFSMLTNDPKSMDLLTEHPLLLCKGVGVFFYFAIVRQIQKANSVTVQPVIAE